MKILMHMIFVYYLEHVIEMAIASLKEKNPNLTITTARLMKATDISKKGK